MSDVTHVSLVAAFNRDGMLLLGRRLDNGRWTVAGGHAEDGEDPDKCAVRELYEEAGLKAKKLTRLDRRELRNGKLVITTYRAEVEGTPTGKNDPDRECDEWHFVDVSDGVPKNIAECMAGPKDPNDNVILDLFGLRKSERLWDGAIDLQKVQSTPTLPKLGYPDNRRETPIINTNRELETKAAAMGAAAARMNRVLGPDAEQAARQDAESSTRTRNAGAVSSVAGRNIAYAKGTPLLAEMFDPGEFKGHRAHPKSPMGTKLHEDFHMMLNRVDKKYGRSRRDKLAHTLFHSLPRGSQVVLNHLNGWRTPQHEDNPEEKLANLFNYLNNPGDRQAFDQHLKQTYPSFGEGLGRHYDVALKRAYRHLQGAMGVADESWVLKQKPWEPEFRARPLARVRNDNDVPMTKAEPTPDEYELGHLANEHDHPERYHVWVMHKPTKQTVGEATFTTRRKYEDENGEPFLDEFEDEYAPGGKRVMASTSGRPAALKGWDVKVHPEHRRRGLASAMYSHASEAYGLPVEPGDFQTPDGEQFLAGLQKTEGEHGEIDRMLRHPDPIERGLALKLHGVQPHHLVQALDDPDPKIAGAAFNHPSADSSVVFQALSEPGLHAAALRHPALTPDLLPFAFDTSRGTEDSADTLQTILAHPLLDERTLRHIYAAGGATPQMMGHRLMPQDLLHDAIVNRNGDDVALAAMGNHSVSPDMVDGVLRGEPSNLWQVAARNAAIPKTVAQDILRRGHMNTDEHQADVRRAIIQNPAVPNDVVEIALHDIEPSIRMLARIRLGQQSTDDAIDHDSNSSDDNELDGDFGPTRDVSMTPEMVMAEWSHR